MNRARLRHNAGNLVMTAFRLANLRSRSPATITLVALGLTLLGMASSVLRVPPAEAQNASKKPGSVLSFVMLADHKWPSAPALEEQIQKRLPNYRRRGTQTQKGMAIGEVDGRLAITVFIAKPNPLSPNESFIRSAWWWPNVEADVARRKAHVIIQLSGTGDPRVDLLQLAKLTAAVIAATNAIGVIWDAADAVWPAQVFLKQIDQPNVEFPVSVLVSVKLGRDTQFPHKDGRPNWLGVTYGLKAFGIKELEIRGFAGAPSSIVNLLMNIAHYLVQKGDILKHNETLGRSLDREYQIKIKPSTFYKGQTVYRLIALDKAPQAKPSDVVK